MQTTMQEIMIILWAVQATEIIVANQQTKTLVTAILAADIATGVQNITIHIVQNMFLIGHKRSVVDMFHNTIKNVAADMFHSTITKHAANTAKKSIAYLSANIAQNKFVKENANGAHNTIGKRHHAHAQHLHVLLLAHLAAHKADSKVDSKVVMMLVTAINSLGVGIHFPTLSNFRI